MANSFEKFGDNFNLPSSSNTGGYNPYVGGGGGGTTIGLTGVSSPKSSTAKDAFNELERRLFYPNSLAPGPFSPPPETESEEKPEEGVEEDDGIGGVEQPEDIPGGDPVGDPAGFDTSQAGKFPFSKDPLDALGALGTGTSIGSIIGFHNDSNMSNTQAQAAAKSRAEDNKTTVEFELDKINNRKAQARYRDAHHSGANLGFAEGTIGAAHASTIQFGKDISPGVYGNIGTYGSYSLPGTNWGLGINDEDVVDLTEAQVETMTAHMKDGVEKSDARALATATVTPTSSGKNVSPVSVSTPTGGSSKGIGGEYGLDDPAAGSSYGIGAEYGLSDAGAGSGNPDASVGGAGEGTSGAGGEGTASAGPAGSDAEADAGGQLQQGGLISTEYQDGGFAPPPEPGPEMGGGLPPELMGMLAGEGGPPQGPPEAGMPPEMMGGEGFVEQPQQPPPQSIPIIVGMVRGPGTEDSDSIQTRVPANSYVVNADAVQIVGIKKLQKMLEEGAQATGWQPDPQDPSLEVINVSAGEFVFPGPFVDYFGVETFDKINDKGFAQSGATQKRREQGVEGTGESIPEETMTVDQMAAEANPEGFYRGGFNKKYQDGRGANQQDKITTNQAIEISEEVAQNAIDKLPESLQAQFRDTLVSSVTYLMTGGAGKLAGKVELGSRFGGLGYVGSQIQPTQKQKLQPDADIKPFFGDAPPRKLGDKKRPFYGDAPPQELDDKTKYMIPRDVEAYEKSEGEGSFSELVDNLFYSIMEGLVRAYRYKGVNENLPSVEDIKKGIEVFVGGEEKKPAPQKKLLGGGKDQSKGGFIG